MAEKPVISDDSNLLEPSLLDELLANIATLSSIYHKPPEVFVTRAKVVTAKTDEEEYLDGNSETAYSETPSHVVSGGSPTASASAVASTSQPASRAPPTGPAAAAAPLPDLLGDLMGMDNSAVVPADDPATLSA